MSKHALLAVVILLLLVVGISAVALYKFANSNLAELPQNFVANSSQESNKTSYNSSWIKELANVSKKEYVFATNEIYIEYSRPTKTKSKTAYRLLIDKNDVYSVFCITQILRNAQVDFTIVKDGAKSHIFLNTSDSELLNRIISELRAYEIHTSVTEVRL